ncbi:hypothetical protein WM019_02930 [Bifidobacterium mongoliense]|jgi:hypothetical protein|uniref:hypothetical protein n=1 Tax=Bifidobacterium mongoliense TaxID=518643 RepID=UPI0026498720|nr:hypothetical protein [Bifidobacterium mongoliense]MDN6554284.1 hypothetical protein [Bifidobacterium mongoliense]MDN6769181.1 hypothetical protein [Bifidobacterium mongoliense]MDN6783573.1 hypothetical protein [Bifidobacterium mongoliense]
MPESQAARRTSVQGGINLPLPMTVIPITYFFIDKMAQNHGLPCRAIPVSMFTSLSHRSL